MLCDHKSYIINYLDIVILLYKNLFIIYNKHLLFWYSLGNC